MDYYTLHMPSWLSYVYSALTTLILVLSCMNFKTGPYSMTLETWMLTETLLSLKAVVMKQPKVNAAMTLREKAKREFALDNAVFIL